MGLSQPLSENAALQDAVLAPTLPLFINDLFTSISNHLHLLPMIPFFIALIPAQVHIKPLPTSIMVLLIWVYHLLPTSGKALLGNLQTVTISLESLPCSPQLDFYSTSLHSTESLPLMGLSVISSPRLAPFIFKLASRAACRVGCL